MNSNDTSPEAERSYPPGYSKVFIINGLIIALVVLLLVVGSQRQGYLGGLGELLLAVGIIAVGTLVNLVLARTAEGGRIGYLVAALLYGSVVLWFMSGLSHMSLKPGG